MDQRDVILAWPETASAGETTIGRQAILVSRINICPVWIAAAFLGCLFVSFFVCRYRVGTEIPQPLDTINPNTAPRESLVRLPGIGPARAMSMIDYRQAHSSQGPAFRTSQDLDAIAGLGPKTVEQMMPWISFDSPGQ